MLGAIHQLLHPGRRSDSTDVFVNYVQSCQKEGKAR